VQGRIEERKLVGALQKRVIGHCRLVGSTGPDG
jgi:hypothetical protein